MFLNLPIHPTCALQLQIFLYRDTVTSHGVAKICCPDVWRWLLLGLQRISLVQDLVFVGFLGLEIWCKFRFYAYKWLTIWGLVTQIGAQLHSLPDPC